jgi:hypothetical protein
MVTTQFLLHVLPGLTFKISIHFTYKVKLYFFIIKPNSCTSFTNLFWHETLHVSDSSFVHLSGVYSLYTQQWYMSYRFADSFRAGPSWSCSKPVWHITLLSVQWINSWWWTEELSQTCRVSCQNKFVKLVHLVGFIIKKFVTMHGHVNLKLYTYYSQQTGVFCTALTNLKSER